MDVVALCMRLEDMDSRIEALKKERERVHSALLSTLEPLLQEKQTGSMTFSNDVFKVVVTMPKKVEWDQGMLADLWTEFPEYVVAKYSVHERTYDALGEEKKLFEKARSVSAGKTSLKIERNKN